MEPFTVLADLNKCKEESTNKLITVEYGAPTLPNKLIKKEFKIRFKIKTII